MTVILMSRSEIDRMNVLRDLAEERAQGETGAAWEFHGSDGSAGAPRLSIHLSRCGLAFTPFVSGVRPVASWCSMVQRCDSETSLRVLRVTCNAGDERCRP